MLSLVVPLRHGRLHFVFRINDKGLRVNVLAHACGEDRTFLGSGASVGVVQLSWMGVGVINAGTPIWGETEVRSYRLIPMAVVTFQFLFNFLEFFSDADHRFPKAFDGRTDRQHLCHNR